ncbi:hypothetical protein MXB_5618 [Myxobolus squamalis]|nr:hypothetical protein MXB_5618 [Myxobolus squamalis]
MNNSYNNQSKKEYHKSLYHQTQEYSRMPLINEKSSRNHNKTALEHSLNYAPCPISKNEELFKNSYVKSYNSLSKHVEKQLFQELSTHPQTQIFGNLMENSFPPVTAMQYNSESLLDSTPKDQSTLKPKSTLKSQQSDISLNAQILTPIDINSFENMTDISFPQDSFLEQCLIKEGTIASCTEKFGIIPPLSMSIDSISHKEDANSVGSLAKRRLSHEPRTCEKCGRSFKYPSDLKKHEQVHQEVKKYTCNECGRTFRRMHQLNVHARIHTGEKPYVCTHCGMSFRHDSTLTMHTRTRHEHLRPFKCDICGKMFGRLSHLRKHQRYVCATTRKQITTNIDGDAPTEFYSYICHQCQSIFIKYVVLRNPSEETYLRHESACIAQSGNTFNESKGMQPYMYSPPLEFTTARRAAIKPS